MMFSRVHVLENRPWEINEKEKPVKKIKFSMITLLSCLFLFGFTGVAAAWSPDFMVNGQWASTFSNGVKTIGLGDNINMEYAWWNISHKDVRWYIKYDGLDYWQELSDLNSDFYPPDHRIYITGGHKIKCEAKRLEWFRWVTGTREVTLKHQVVSNTHATRYPIFLIPGVNGFSAVNIVDTLLKTDWNLDEFDMAYFHGIARNLRNGHNQHVIDVSLSAWQETVIRGKDLRTQIFEHLYTYDPCFAEGEGKLKVNIIAHSHGSTTSRVAVAELARTFQDPAIRAEWGLDAPVGSRVASLTTVAGPHFGTPSAEGGHQFRAMLNENVGPGTGDGLWDRAKVFFQSMGVWLAVLSDNRRHIGEGTDGYDINNWQALLDTQNFDQVALDFTQPYMYRFNEKTYPCAGLPSGAKYVLEDDDIFIDGNGDIRLVIDPDIIVDENLLVTEADLADPVVNPEGFDNKYNLAYGHTAKWRPEDNIEEGVCGDGLGNRVDCDCENAVRYYSFSGHAPYATLESGIDPFDIGLLLFNSFHPIVGQDWDDLPLCYQDTRLYGLEGMTDIMRDAFYANPSLDNFWDILQSIYGLGELTQMSVCIDGDSGAGADHPHMLDNADITGYRDGIGYVNATDSFIPVDSANFGQYLDTWYWNHADEQNMTIGWVNTSHPNKQDPIEYYDNHVKLLKSEGF